MMLSTFEPTPSICAPIVLKNVTEFLNMRLAGGVMDRCFFAETSRQHYDQRGCGDTGLSQHDVFAIPR